MDTPTLPPPPLPLTLAIESDNPLYTSATELRRISLIEPPMMSTPVHGNNIEKSDSASELLERLSPDLPAGKAEPISINRDILELEDMYSEPTGPNNSSQQLSSSNEFLLGNERIEEDVYTEL